MSSSKGSISDIQFQSTTVRDSTASAKLERIGAHSHITGLGLNELLEAVPAAAVASRGSSNFVGQIQARRSLGIILKLIRRGQLAGRGILLAGPPSTGKTALATALSAEIGSNVPFVSVSASQVYSSHRSKTEFLNQSVRRAMAVSIQEETDVIEGEVVEIQTSTALEPGKSSGRITLCTTEMETIYDLGHKMLEHLRKEKISSGDVIRIDKGSGKISKLGRSFARSRDYDAVSSSTKFVATPEGELQKRKTVNHVVSLHEMDVINSRQQGFLALFSGDTGEISSELRSQVDAKVAEWKEEGRAKLVSGVLFIDEAHLLDLDCFSFLNTALEQPLAPVLVIATNRGMSPIRGAGSKHTSPHGIPADFLDRLLIVSTEPYDVEELRQILVVRSVQEDTDLEETALELLTRIGQETSLRYAMQLIALSKLRASKRRGRSRSTAVTIEDVEAVYNLFYDVKRSTRLVLEHSEDFLFHEDSMMNGAAAVPDADASSQPPASPSPMVEG